MYECDKAGAACEFAFIPCLIKKGSNICRQSDDTLNVYIPSIKIVNRLLKEYPDIFRPFQVGDTEGTLLFKESDIEKAAVILKARVMGKGMNPKPKRRVNFSEEYKKLLTERLMQGRVSQ